MGLVTGVAPLIACPALWFELGWRIEQPPQQVAIPEQMFNNGIATCLKHAGYDTSDLHGWKDLFLALLPHKMCGSCALDDAT